MVAYIVRRLLLIIPTLLGILLLNFLIVQLAPGGPVEQTIADLQGFGDTTGERIGSGSSSDMASTQSSEGTGYRGAQGLDPFANC